MPVFPQRSQWRQIPATIGWHRPACATHPKEASQRHAAAEQHADCGLLQAAPPGALPRQLDVAGGLRIGKAGMRL
eukprot:18135-Chlamydomonas_euryale.AAC.1